MMRNNVFYGAEFLFSGFGWLMKKGLKRYVLIPLFVNIIIFACLLDFSAHYFQHFVAWVDSHTPHWLHWLNWVLWPIFVAAMSLVVVYTFTIIANLVGAPFNAFLSEKTEQLYLGHKPNEGESFFAGMKDLPRSFKMQIHLILYLIPRFVLMVILLIIAFFIPGVNLLVSIMWFVFNAWYMALQYLNYPMDNHRLTFPLMLKSCRTQKWSSLGFGAIVAIASMVPVLNFFVMPAAVIGATKLNVEMNLRQTTVAE
jgi:CysZ protein